MAQSQPKFVPSIGTLSSLGLLGAVVWFAVLRSSASLSLFSHSTPLGPNRYRSRRRVHTCNGRSSQFRALAMLPRAHSNFSRVTLLGLRIETNRRSVTLTSAASREWYLLTFTPAPLLSSSVTLSSTFARIQRLHRPTLRILSFSTLRSIGRRWYRALQARKVSGNLSVEILGQVIHSLRPKSHRPSGSLQWRWSG